MRIHGFSGRVVISPGLTAWWATVNQPNLPCGNDLGHVLPLYVSFIRTHTYIWLIRRIVYFSFQLRNLTQSSTYTKPPTLTVVLGPILPTPAILLSPSLHIKTNRRSSIIVKSALFCVHRCFGIRYTMFSVEVISLICS